MALALALGLAIQSASAAPVRYALDPVHTRVVFAVDHAGFSQALGAVSGSEGVLEFDPDDWSSARLDVRVPLQRLDLGDDKWNQATLARNLLDAERHPEAHFVSTRVEPVDGETAIVHGRLSLRGVTRDVALQVRLNALKRHPMPPFRRTVGFSATTELSRSDFGIDAWPSMIGDRVHLRIEVEAVRRSGDAIDPDDAPATAPLPSDQPLPAPPQPVPEHTP